MEDHIFFEEKRTQGTEKPVPVLFGMPYFLFRTFCFKPMFLSLY